MKNQENCEEWDNYNEDESTTVTLAPRAVLQMTHF